MNKYTISLTVTNEENNEQFIQLHTVHLTGKQVKELTDMTLDGILVEPEPEILVPPKPPKPPKKKRRLGIIKHSTPTGAEDA